MLVRVKAAQSADDTALPALGVWKVCECACLGEYPEAKSITVTHCVFVRVGKGQ